MHINIKLVACLVLSSNPSFAPSHPSLGTHHVVHSLHLLHLLLLQLLLLHLLLLHLLHLLLLLLLHHELLLIPSLYHPLLEQVLSSRDAGLLKLLIDLRRNPVLRAVLKDGLL